MKKSLFLLFVAVTLLVLLKEQKKTYSLERLDFVSTQRIEFKGLLHIPRTLTFAEEVVKPEVKGLITLQVKDTTYFYRRIFAYNTYYMEQAYIVPVIKGDKVKIDFSRSNVKGTPAIKLFVEKEL